MSTENRTRQVLARMQRPGNPGHGHWERQRVRMLWILWKTGQSVLEKLEPQLLCGPAIQLWTFAQKNQDENLKKPPAL